MKRFLMVLIMAGLLIAPVWAAEKAQKEPAPTPAKTQVKQAPVQTEFLFPVVGQFRANGQFYLLRMTGFVVKKDSQGRDQLFLRGVTDPDLVKVNLKEGYLESIPWETLYIQNPIKKTERQPIKK